MTNESRTHLPVRKLLTPTEVARYLGVSVKTVYRWCEMGLLESVKLNTSVRIMHDSLIDFLRDKKL